MLWTSNGMAAGQEAESGERAPALEVRGLSVAYHGRTVLESIDFRAPERGLIAIIGPNGAGKSTFIKACLGLVPRRSGSVRVLGRPVDQQRRLIGYVPQRSAVDWEFPISAREVVEMGLYGQLGWFRRIGRRERSLAMEALERVGMTAFADRQIGQLSGGQQQRVFLARALAQDARVYFMDEPLAGVDAATEDAIFTLLAELDRRGRTVFVVHHDLETVAGRFDHALLLNRRLMAAGPARVVLAAPALAETYGRRMAELVAERTELAAAAT